MSATLLISILLQTNVNDITFRTMDVVMIVGGVASLLTIFFTLKNTITNNTDKIATLKEEMKHLENELEKVKLDNGTFKTAIFAKFDEQNKELHQLSIMIEKFKNEILQQIKK